MLRIVTFAPLRAVRCAAVASARPSQSRCFCSNRASSQTVHVTKTGSAGLLTVPLPTQGPTVFSIEPHSTVRQFTQDVKEEDTKALAVRVFDFEGDPVAGSVRISSLATEGFQIVVNDTTIVVNPLDDVLFTTDLAREDCLDTVLAEIKSLKEEEAAAGAAVVEEEDEDNLHPPSHVRTEIVQLEETLADAQKELAAYAPVAQRVAMQGKRRSQRFWLVTLAAMSAQWGFLAELTFNQFSWDLMEPVTYFVTYSTSIAIVMYYISTQTAFDFRDVSNREQARAWHKEAPGEGLGMDHYNALRSTITSVEGRLHTLRVIDRDHSPPTC